MGDKPPNYGVSGLVRLIKFLKFESDYSILNLDFLRYFLNEVRGISKLSLGFNPCLRFHQEVKIVRESYAIIFNIMYNLQGIIKGYPAGL